MGFKSFKKCLVWFCKWEIWWYICVVEISKWEDLKIGIMFEVDVKRFRWCNKVGLGCNEWFWKFGGIFKERLFWNFGCFVEWELYV